MTRRLFAPLLGVALLVACSSPPDKERHQAEGAIAAAREAGADVYAPTELATAETTLNKYAEAVAQRDYRLALSLAVEARDTAYQAARRSADGKAEARSAADRLDVDVTRLLNLARARLASPAVRAASAIRLRTAVPDAEGALQEARAAVARGDYQAAVTRLEPVSAGLHAELGATSGAAAKRSR